ncbi:MAG: AAA family ATPase [Candidatus Spechtbacterales bacterium]|nr:AAA family ATPase [Candidatus Spechtbacterales bacterium]
MADIEKNIKNIIRKENNNSDKEISNITNQHKALEELDKNSIIPNIYFIPEKDKHGEIVGYRSSSKNRKAIKLSEESLKPSQGVPYSVKIKEDTNPEDPTKGYYVGEIVEHTGSDISAEEWERVEEKVGKAQSKKRKEAKIRTGETLEGKTTLSKRLKTRKDAEQEALRMEAEDEVEDVSVLAEALEEFQTKNLREALSRLRKIEKQRASLIEEEAEILNNIEDEISGVEHEVLAEIREELDALDKEYQELLNSSPEAFYGLHLHELREYRKALREGKIVETPYVKEQAEDMVAHMRAGIPVMLYGHLGSGKTELAMHVAREYIEKDALIISGSKHTSLAELYGHQSLAIDKLDTDEVGSYVEAVEERFKKWVEENPDASEEDKNRAHDRILQTYLKQSEGGTISEFYLGPVYQAMKEGRPVIVDEVNAIPHEVLISLNNILTRRPGDVIRVQQDSGEELVVQEGFSVVMTGNLNQGQDKYVGRQDMDPAFLSRLHKIEYDYLPQITEGPLETEAGEGNELYALLLSYIMDKHGNIEAPKDSLKKLWRLAQAARIIQNIFAGKEVSDAYYFQQQGGSRRVKPILRESVLSVRSLENILTAWQQGGYKREIDYYLWKEFVEQSTVPQERAYLYQLLKDRFTFFQSDGWEQSPDYGAGGNTNSFDVDVPENDPPEGEFFHPREVVEAAFGPIPERNEWPKVQKEESSKAEEEVEEVNFKQLGDISDMDEFREGVATEIDDLENALRDA